MKEEEALVILSSIPHLGSIKIRLLIHRFGSAKEALEADDSEWQDLPGFGEKVLEGKKRWIKDISWQKNLDLANRLGARIVSFTHSDYPRRLLDTSDFPVLLYVKGDLKLLNAPCIAIVGTRQCTVYGSEMAEKIARDLASWGFPVVSGLARGIDTAAHQGALNSGKTIAVIGSGLADIYPKENKSLAHAIMEKGALVSEFSMSTPPDKLNFPQRNRIVSGMSMGTLLIEAPSKSGAMITMHRAKTQERPRFALPGRVDYESFSGNHLLIKSGEAQLVECAQDIAGKFNNLFSVAGQLLPPPQKVPLELEEEKLLAQLPSEEIPFDEIIHLTQLPVMKINVLLMSLVLKKVVKEFPGKVYKKRC